MLHACYKEVVPVMALPRDRVIERPQLLVTHIVFTTQSSSIEQMPR